MIAGVGTQIRLAVIPTPEGFVTRTVGLDFTAVMLTAGGAGVDLVMLTDILPRIEAAIVNPIPDEEGAADDDDA